MVKTRHQKQLNFSDGITKREAWFFCKPSLVIVALFSQMNEPRQVTPFKSMEVEKSEESFATATSQSSIVVSLNSVSGDSTKHRVEEINGPQAAVQR